MKTYLYIHMFTHYIPLDGHNVTSIMVEKVYHFWFFNNIEEFPALTYKHNKFSKFNSNS
jgi:hypothetical protein